MTMENSIKSLIVTSFHEDSSYFYTQEDNKSILHSPIEFMEDFSKEPFSKNENPLKPSLINDSWLFKETEGMMVSDFQEAAKIHDENLSLENAQMLMEREKVGVGSQLIENSIETPSEIFIYEEEEDIVSKFLSSLEQENFLSSLEDSSLDSQGMNIKHISYESSFDDLFHSFGCD